MTSRKMLITGTAGFPSILIGAAMLSMATPVIAQYVTCPPGTVYTGGACVAQPIYAAPVYAPSPVYDAFSLNLGFGGRGHDDHGHGGHDDHDDHGDHGHGHR